MAVRHPSAYVTMPRPVCPPDRSRWHGHWPADDPLAEQRGNEWASSTSLRSKSAGGEPRHCRVVSRRESRTTLLRRRRPRTREADPSHPRLIRLPSARSMSRAGERDALREPMVPPPAAPTVNTRGVSTTGSATPWRLAFGYEHRVACHSGADHHVPTHWVDDPMHPPHCGYPAYSPRIQEGAVETEAPRGRRADGFIPRLGSLLVPPLREVEKRDP